MIFIFRNFSAKIEPSSLVLNVKERKLVADNGESTGIQVFLDD